MAIVGVRFDQRLIHGQVATFWTNFLKVDRIVVLDEEVFGNDMLKATLRMAVPQGVNSSIILKEKFVANYTAGKYGTQRLLIVFRDMDVLSYLLENGVEITELNLGNRPDKGGDTRIAKHFCVGPHEVEAIRAFEAKGIHVYSQLVPQDPVYEAEDLLKSAGL